MAALLFAVGWLNNHAISSPVHFAAIVLLYQTEHNLTESQMTRSHISRLVHEVLKQCHYSPVPLGPKEIIQRAADLSLPHTAVTGQFACMNLAEWGQAMEHCKVADGQPSSVV